MKNEQEIIQLWNELEITHIDFEFTCGGDSMNDTTLNIHKGDEIIENDVIATYFDNEVYNAVEFILSPPQVNSKSMWVISNSFQSWIIFFSSFSILFICLFKDKYKKVSHQIIL